MDFGTLSTLGLGSQGVLTNDIIDKLKEADKSSIVTPIENKKTAVENQKNELSEIKKLVSDLNSVVTNMTYDTVYDKVDTDIVGDSVSINTTGRVEDQNISINVLNLASQDIYESKDGFSSKDATLESGKFDLKMGDTTYSIGIDDGDTLEDLVNKINANTDSKLQASILNVGGDNPYRLIIKSTQTGADNSFSIDTDSDSFGDDFDHIKSAADATFEVDGVEIQRSSNQVDDLFDHISIKLEKTGLSNISIKKDNSDMLNGIKDFVEKFNAVIKKINDDTKYDAQKKEAGIFQGNSQIRSIARDLQDIIVSTVSKDNKRAYDFGLEIQRDGTLSFDENKFNQAYAQDPDEAVEFFKASNATDGLFNRLEDKLFDISTSSKGLLKTFDKNLEDKIKRYDDELTKAQARLDAQYNILEKQFASYDLIMGKLDTQAQTLDSMIKEQFAQKD